MVIFKVVPLFFPDFGQLTELWLLEQFGRLFKIGDGPPSVLGIDCRHTLPLSTILLNRTIQAAER
jgi:hypothetical protein